MNQNILTIGDLITKVLSFIDNAKIYKIVRLVNKQWQQSAGDRVDEFCNQLWTLIDKFPTVNWCWSSILRNQNTKPEMILTPNTLEIKEEIIKNIEFDNWIISKKKEKFKNDYSVDEWREYLINFIYSYLSHNPNITDNMVLINPKLKNYSIYECYNTIWDKMPEHMKICAREIMKNPNTLSKLIPKYIDDLDDYSYMLHWYWISKHPNITWKYIQDHPEYPWEWDGISENPNITWDIIKNNLDKPWNGEGISSNPNITLDIIYNNPNKIWNLRGIAKNPNITWQMIHENMEKSTWCIEEISLNPNITWRMITTYPDFHWDFKLLSRNTFDSKIKDRKYNIGPLTDYHNQLIMFNNMTMTISSDNEHEEDDSEDEDSWNSDNIEEALANMFDNS